MESKPPKTKIVFVLLGLTTGGSERMIINIANNLNRELFDISMVTFHLDKEFCGLLKSDVEIQDLNSDINNRNPLINFPRLFSLIKSLKKISPDIIFSSGFYVNLLCLIAKLLTPLKATYIIRETSLMVTYLRSSFKGKIFIWLFKIFYPQADIFVAPSQAILDDFRPMVQFKEKQIRIIPNFIDTRMIEDGLKQETTTTFPPLSERPVIISVGRLDEVKGYEDALQAIQKVLKNIPCDYWIVGPGPMEQKLKKLSQELKIDKHIFFLGNQKNPYPFLKRANMFLLSSHLEGFPNAVLEAMYCSLPCVVTRFNTSVTDLIENGVQGYIVSPRDVNEMAAALNRLLSDPEKGKEMGIQAKNKGKYFSQDHGIQRYEQLFLERRSSHDF